MTKIAPRVEAVKANAARECLPGQLFSEACYNEGPTGVEWSFEKHIYNSKLPSKHKHMQREAFWLDFPKLSADL